VPKAEFSVGGSFGPNLATDEGWYSGLGVRFLGSRGLDPHGFRTTTEVRIDAASGDSTFGRAAMELTFLRGFGRSFDGALTLGGGTSVGGVPVQHRWYLGGSQTVRGQDPSAALSGNAFWLARAELGRPIAFMRVAAFGDLGWAGDRTKVDEVGRPASGIGLGLSFLDGTLRLDVARGIFPMQQTRVSFYLGSRF
jgi:hemolysin activation/secretion protein